MTPRPLLLALLVVLPLAGCAGGPEAAPGPVAATPALREDTREFILAAGGSLEYKLALREGAQLEFTWSAPRAVFFDFHGDQGDGPGAAFASHKSGTAAVDQGTFTAPFEGRHGWYWENRNRESVHVTLTTKGDYAVVGIVG